METGFNNLDNRVKYQDIASKVQCDSFDLFREITNDLFVNNNIGLVIQKDDSNKNNNDVTVLAKNVKQTQAVQHLLKPINEHVLSQKMSQLSTHTVNETSTTMMKSIQDEINKIPDYLTKQNQSFKQMLYQVLSTMLLPTTNKNMEDLRKITLLRYKIINIQAYHTLWTTYLKSGMGQLIIPSKQDQEERSIYSTNVSVWSEEIIKAMIIQKSINMNKTNENGIYIHFVTNHLHELDHLLQQYEVELNRRTNNFYRYTLTIQDMLETYLQQNRSSLRMKIEHKIELVYYDYQIRALKLAYNHHNPNLYQKQLMKQLCCSKYEQETAEQEFHLLQRKMTYNNASYPLMKNSTIISLLPSLNSVQDPNIREQFIEQYREVTKKAIDDLFSIYKEAAEKRREKYNKKFDIDMKKMWSDRYSSLENEKIPLAMINLIEKRYNKISERIRCIYKFKATECTHLNRN